MPNKTSSSVRRDANDVVDTDEFIGLDCIANVILNNGETADEIWSRGAIVVMVYNMSAVSEGLRETLTTIGWDGTTRVFGLDRAQACVTLGAVHDLQAAWAGCERDGVGQILVATNHGLVLVNLEPEGEGFSFDPACLATERDATENPVRINARSNGRA